jgi:cytochrome c oxidase subunit 2
MMMLDADGASQINLTGLKVFSMIGKGGEIGMIRNWISFLLIGFALCLLSCGRSSDSDQQVLSPAGKSFNSNGEQIYFTGTSRRRTPISSEERMGMMGMMRGRDHLACVDCHGSDGKGGTVEMMMMSFKAPDIRYKVLASKEHIHQEAGEAQTYEMDHPPYTDETLKRAIAAGLDPAGNPLSQYMPRWKMSDDDLNDLLAFLKTIK